MKRASRINLRKVVWKKWSYLIRTCPQLWVTQQKVFKDFSKNYQKKLNSFKRICLIKDTSSSITSAKSWESTVRITRRVNTNFTLTRTLWISEWRRRVLRTKWLYTRGGPFSSLYTQVRGCSSYMLHLLTRGTFGFIHSNG